MGPIMAQRSADRRKKPKKKDTDGPKEPKAETEDRVGATITAVVGSEEFCGPRSSETRANSERWAVV